MLPPAHLQVLLYSSLACPPLCLGIWNLEVLCKWFRPDIYRTDFRSILLKEHIKIGSEIFTPDLVTPIRKTDAAQTVPNGAHHVVFLSLEPVRLTVTQSWYFARPRTGVREWQKTSATSGVNLPSCRVMIHTPMFHGSVIDPLVYRQIISRAGRFGEDIDGESCLICQPNEKHSVMRIIAAQPQPLKKLPLLSLHSPKLLRACVYLMVHSTRYARQI